MEIKILLLMILCHIIDDFVLQPVCLSNLKQKQWWEKNVLNISKKYRDMYEDDYEIALLIHSLSWSIMISLPFMFLVEFNQIALIIMVVINTIIHYIVDDLKANKFKINLWFDQGCHFLQLILTYVILYNI